MNACANEPNVFIYLLLSSRFNSSEIKKFPQVLIYFTQHGLWLQLFIESPIIWDLCLFLIFNWDFFRGWQKPDTLSKEQELCSSGRCNKQYNLCIKPGSESRIREYDDENNHGMMMMMIKIPATTMHQWCNDDDDDDNDVLKTWTCVLNANQS